MRVHEPPCDAARTPTHIQRRQPRRRRQRGPSVSLGFGSVGTLRTTPPLERFRTCYFNGFLSADEHWCSRAVGHATGVMGPGGSGLTKALAALRPHTTPIGALVGGLQRCQLAPSPLQERGFRCGASDERRARRVCDAGAQTIRSPRRARGGPSETRYRIYSYFFFSYINTNFTSRYRNEWSWPTSAGNDSHELVRIGYNFPSVLG